ncbi:MAG: hypothetical protein AAGA89_03820 [Pseudomonadota bacterium]
MIRTAELIRFDRVSTSGRNRPPLVSILTEDDEELEAVLKPAGWRELQVSSVTKELISSIVGGLVGLPICEPFLVDADPKFIGAVQDLGLRNEFAGCTWPAFATRHAGNQWQNWSIGDKLSGTRLELGLSVLFFDAVSDNSDRGGTTPNLLVKGAEIRAIDHELCFPGNQLIGMATPPPWDPGGMEWLKNSPKKNVLLEPASKHDDLDFESIRTAWSDLADEEIDAILTLIPQNWGGGQALSLAHSAIQRIKGVRDNIDGCIAELTRVLSQ